MEFAEHELLMIEVTLNDAIFEIEDILDGYDKYGEDYQGFDIDAEIEQLEEEYTALDDLAMRVGYELDKYEDMDMDDEFDFDYEDTDFDMDVELWETIDA